MKHLIPFVLFIMCLSCEKGPKRTVYVMAEATITAEPQVAQVELGVEDSAKNASAAYKKVEDRSRELKAMLVRLGVKEENITTRSFWSEQRYQYSYWYWYEEGKFKGYTVHQTMSFKTPDFERLGELIDSATSMKGVRLENISFIVDSPEVFIQEARIKALEMARGKASDLAEASGLELGLPISVNEYVVNPGEQDYSYYYYNYYAQSLYSAMAPREEKAMGGAEAAPTGGLKGKIYVYVTYEAKPTKKHSGLLKPKK
ncbi:MAG: SIMPL domain-containing protein [candidate division WOR-3 bacterium]